jgi:hypothetical protein
MFDFGYPNWGENPPFHAPVLVVTHRGQERISKSGGTSYTFATGGIEAATGGIEAAVEQARAVAEGKDVLVAGGVNVARQALAAGLVDEVVLHVVPKLVGRGVRLFDSARCLPCGLQHPFTSMTDRPRAAGRAGRDLPGLGGRHGSAQFAAACLFAGGACVSVMAVLRQECVAVRGCRPATGPG